jgi:hypothetical protein
MHRSVPALLFLAACSREPRLVGQVVDIWGEPVEGATVVLDQLSERPLTDKNGKFDLPALPGAHKIKAGREGYIQEHQEVTVVEGEPPPKVLFELYPKPEEPGFYAVGDDRYLRLEPEPVYQRGGELESVRGIKSLGEASLQGTSLRVVFHTPLKMDQVMRLVLGLHQLEHVASMNMIGPFGPTAVDVNLWESKKEVDIHIEPMRSRTDYLITSTGTLDAGGFAFDTQKLLTAGDLETFKEIPEPLRVAYPVEIR